jgi:UDP-N-acetylglucosamine transferase subunit ALG13
MIFVTVGTDHHPFDRLVKDVDLLREKGIIEENVFIQIGTSRYRPKFCEYSDFLPYDHMAEKMKEARIVITHGGPGSIMPLIYRGKIPVVLSRQKKFGEAVDDHQISFSKRLEEKNQIIAAHDADELEEKIKNYEAIVQRMKSAEKTQRGLNDRASQFARALDEICEQLIQEGK